MLTRKRNSDNHRRRDYLDRNPQQIELIKARIRRKRLTNPEWYLWDKAKRRAQKERLPFDIEVSDIIIPKQCPALGIPLIVLSGTENSPTLDKIHNERGYVKGNVIVVSRRANTIKSDATLVELEKVLKCYRRLMK